MVRMKYIAICVVSILLFSTTVSSADFMKVDGVKSKQNRFDDYCNSGLVTSWGIGFRATGKYWLDYAEDNQSHESYILIIKGPSEYLSTPINKAEAWDVCQNRKIEAHMLLPEVRENEALSLDCNDANEMPYSPGEVVFGIVSNKVGLKKARRAWIASVVENKSSIREIKNSDRIYCSVLPGVDNGGGG